MFDYRKWSKTEYHERWKSWACAHDNQPLLYLLSYQLLIIMSTSPTYIAMVAPYYVQMYSISDPHHHVGEVISRSSSWLVTNITAIKHGWLCYVYHCVCTIVRWLCHSGQVQDLAVGFDQDAAAPAVVMTCLAMRYSKMVGFSTHSSLESTKQTIPASFHLLSIFSPPLSSTVHLPPLWHPVPLGMLL